MFCNRCGSPIRDGNLFCSNCGTPASRPSAPITTYAPPVTPVEVPAHDRPPVSSYVRTDNRSDDSGNSFLFAAPDLDMTMDTPAPKPSSEPFYIPPLDSVSEPEVSIEAKAPVVEEPVIVPPLEPVYEQPVAVPVAEPVYEQPVAAPVAEPVYEQPVVAPVAEPVFGQPTYENSTYKEPPVSYGAPKHKAGKTSVVIKIISVFLCIFMFASILGAVGTLTVRSLVSEDSAKNIANTLDVKTIAEKCEIDNYFFVNIEPDDLQEIYDDEDAAFKPFVEEALLGYSKYLTGDGSLANITEKEYGEAIEKSADVINEKSDKDINFDVIKSDFKYENPNSSDLKPIKTMISWYVIIGLLVLFVIFALLLFVLRKFKVTAWLWNGITIFVAGLCYTVLSFVLPMFMKESKLAQILYEDYVQNKILIGGIIVMGVGLLFVIGFVVIKLILRKKNK